MDFNVLRMSRLLLVLGTCVFAAMVACDKDPSVPICRPHALLFETDSIVYTYEAGRITTVLYYGSGLLTNRDNFSYNSAGQLTSVLKFYVGVDGSTAIASNHVLSYGNDGLPLTLTSDDTYNGHFETTFTHDDQSRLSIADTRYGAQDFFAGTTRYEYDENGNIPNVYYTIDFNGTQKEVLARENLSFDDRQKFYVNTPELKTATEYVYGYLPNRNNCLGATVYYRSYAQHFTQPLSITFAATYNDEGLIKSLQSDNPDMRLYSGETLFKAVDYDCH